MNDPMIHDQPRQTPRRPQPPARPAGGQQQQQVQIRTFIAITPPQRLISEMRRLQQRLARTPDKMIRWCEPEQLHLTLRFLGNIRREQVPELEAAVRQATEEMGAFKLSLERLGCFPHTRAPRVIWIGVGNNWETLRRLQERIQRDTESFGESPESRDFQPHITLARVKAPSPRLARPAGQLVESAGIVQLGEWLVGRVDIIQSRLTGQRATYTTLATVKLDALPGMSGDYQVPSWR